MVMLCMRIALAVIFHALTSTVNAQCSGSESFLNKVRIVGLFEIHPTPDCNKNEELSVYGLSLALAAEYILDLVNKGDSDISVPGVQYEFQLNDVCRNRSLATRKAAMNIPETLWTYQSVCFNQSLDSDQQESLLLGFVGPAFSSNAMYVAEFLNNTNIPLISPAATLGQLSDKTRYHSLLRTATSDDIQSKAIIDIAFKLEWSFVLLIHIDSDYGKQGAEAIQTYGESKGICFSAVIEVQMDPVDHLTYYEDIAKIIKSDQAMGVIYFGFSQQVISIIESYSYLTKDSPIASKTILASEGVGTNAEVLRQVEASQGKIELITVSPYNKPNNLESYIQQRVDGTRSGIPETNKLIERFRQDCSRNRRCSNNVLVKATDATQATLNAVVALVLAFKQAQKIICKNNVAVCNDLSQSPLFYSTMRKLLFAMEVNTRIEEENITFGFDNEGEVNGNAMEPSFNINIAKQVGLGWSYKQEGNYYRNRTWVFNGEHLFASIGNSRCAVNCEHCRQLRSPYVYRRNKNSKYIIAGTGIVRHGLSQYDCDKDVRAHGFIMMETFYYTVELISNITSIQFSTVFIDTCRAKLGTQTIMNQIFREENHAYLTDPVGKEWKVKPTDFIVFISGSSSGTSIALQTYLDLYIIPQISYKSTSVWLSDSLRFPWFLRNVPNDEEQARLMIEVVRRNKWNEIGLIYSDSVYGQTGGDLVQKHASINNICISFMRKVESGTQDAVDQLALDTRNAAHDNRLPKVIIFFAEDGLIRQFLQKTKLIDPEWADRGNILIGSETWGNLLQVIEGVEDFVYGSLTFSFSDSVYSWTINNVNYFQQYLNTQKPANNLDNYLFIQFWQQYFDCYLVQDPLPTSLHKCDDSLSLAYTKSVSQHLDYEDTTSKHIVMAGLSVAYGIVKAIDNKTHCTLTGNNINCSALFDTTTGRTDYVQYIKQAKIPQQANSDFKTYTPFLPSGDGKANYDIYNIIQNEDGTASYEKAYEITDGADVELQKPRFYVDGVPVNVAKSECDARCSCINLAQNPSQLSDNSSVPVLNETYSNITHIASLLQILLSVLVLFVVLLSAIHLITLRKRLIKIEKMLDSEVSSASLKSSSEEQPHAEDASISILTSCSKHESSAEKNVDVGRECLPLETYDRGQESPNGLECVSVNRQYSSLTIDTTIRDDAISDGFQDNLLTDVTKSPSLPKMFKIVPISRDINKQ